MALQVLEAYAEDVGVFGCHLNYLLNELRWSELALGVALCGSQMVMVCVENFELCHDD